MIRVIGGSFRGRKIKAPKGLTTRPVLARVREALFNVIGDVDSFSILDLYAGTGAVGIEALSRGAEQAVFVDSGFRQCRIIHENLALLGIEAEVIRADALAIVERFSVTDRTFDLIFADPPYERELGIQTLQAVCEGRIVTQSGIIALTVRKTEDFPETVCSCNRFFDRRYGDTRLVVYALSDNEQ